MISTWWKFSSYCPFDPEKGFSETFSDRFFSSPVHSQNLMSGVWVGFNCYLIILTGQPIIRTHKSSYYGDIFISSYSWSPSVAKFIFNPVSAFWKCLKPPENQGTKLDSSLLLEIIVIHFQNAPEKNRFTQKLVTDQQITLASSNLHWRVVRR